MQRSGFTLIELSIVLVIIGLIVGGVLVGRDLIATSAARATVAQIESYNTAANTFRSKYNNYLPGDIPEPDASQFGFSTRGSYPGQGDGNYIIQGNWNNTAGGLTTTADAGESVMFWADMSRVGLIKDKFTAASPSALPATPGGYLDLSSNPSFSAFLPLAALGNRNYLYVCENANANYYTFGQLTYYGWGVTQNVGLTVLQASYIDKKYDDGLPQGGKITARYPNAGPIYWAAGGGANGASPGTAAPPSVTTCYDNGGNAASPMIYSMNQNAGAGVNCALSFQF